MRQNKGNTFIFVLLDEIFTSSYTAQDPMTKIILQ